MLEWAFLWTSIEFGKDYLVASFSLILADFP